MLLIDNDDSKGDGEISNYLEGNHFMDGAEESQHDIEANKNAFNKQREQ